MEPGLRNLCVRNILWYLKKIYQDSALCRQYERAAGKLSVQDADSADLYDAILSYLVHPAEERMGSVRPLNCIFNLLFQNGTRLKYPLPAAGTIAYPREDAEIDAGQWQALLEGFLHGLETLPPRGEVLNRLPEPAAGSRHQP